jgi:hypothetical protein
VAGRSRLVGWQGVTLTAPESWNFVAYGGDAQEGSFRLDNEAPTASSPLGIEIRWLKQKRAMKDSDLEARLAAMFKGKERASRRDETVDSKSKIVDDKAHPERVATRSYQWKADRKAIGRIWYCGECKRLLIAQVVAGVKGDPSAAGETLASIACHPVDEDWRVWSLYDLQTAVPAGFSLAKQPQLMNIYVALSFERHAGESITVEQWGVADVQVKGRYLDEWFRDKSGPAIADVDYEEEESEAHGHKALTIVGKRGGLVYWAGTGVQQVVRMQKPARHYAACVWECPESNKVHQVQCFSQEPCEETVRKIVERTQCHF